MQMRFTFLVAGLIVTSCKQGESSRPPTPPVKVVEAPSRPTTPQVTTSADAGAAPSHDAGAVATDAGTTTVDAGAAVPDAGQAGKKPAPKKGSSK